MPDDRENSQATPTSRLEPNRPKRLLATAAKLRVNHPQDEEALKLAENLEGGAKYLQSRLN